VLLVASSGIPLTMASEPVAPLPQIDPEAMKAMMYGPKAT